jgi:IS30 family transposase
MTVSYQPSQQESQHMLTQEEAVEISALLKRRWTVSTMARHLGRDRKTVRAYMKGERQPGRRKPAAADWFTPF